MKIFLILIYWIFCIVLPTLYFSIGDNRLDTINNILERYVGCMAGGNRKGHDCQMLRLELEAQTVPGLDATYLIGVGFLNFASLMYVIEFQAVKKCASQAAKKLY